jgi:hypothetical protein
MEFRKTEKQAGANVIHGFSGFPRRDSTPRSIPSLKIRALCGSTRLFRTRLKNRTGCE